MDPSATPAVSQRPTPPQPSSDLGTTIKKVAPGLLLAAVVGAISFVVSKKTPAMSPLIWAILIGAVLANAVKLPASLHAGIGFSAKHVLRLAVGLLGLRLGIKQVLAVGPKGILVVLVAVSGTFLFTMWVGKKLRLAETLRIVLGAGTSICGAAAIVAVAGVVDAKEEETAVGVGTVTLYGTLAMFLYPFIGAAIEMKYNSFGLWAGACVHEVAQVVAAAGSFDSLTGATKLTSAVGIATVVKLGRVLLLAPVTIILSFIFRERAAARGAKVSLIPWFIGLFIATMIVRSVGVLPDGVIKHLVDADGILLAVAMAGLGLDLRWAKVKAAGLKPLLAALVGSAFIALVTFALIRVLG